MSPFWHETVMPTALRDVRSQGHSGKHMLAWSFSGFYPTRTSRGWLASLEIRCPRSFRVLICPCVRLSQRLGGSAATLADYHSGLKPNAYYVAQAEKDRLAVGLRNAEV